MAAAPLLSVIKMYTYAYTAARMAGFKSSQTKRLVASAQFAASALGVRHAAAKAWLATVPTTRLAAAKITAQPRHLHVPGAACWHTQHASYSLGIRMRLHTAAANRARIMACPTANVRHAMASHVTPSQLRAAMAWAMACGWVKLTVAVPANT